MKNRKAVTLIELILVLALIGLVVPTATSMLLLGENANSMAVEEFDLQSDLRVVATILNNTIRDSGGIFILHRDNSNKLTEEWNYIMLNDSKDKLVEWRWDDTSQTHKQVELLGVDGRSTLDIVYNKRSKPNEDNLLEFTLTILNQEDGNREITSELESVNSLQVVDRAYGKIANTLAYRNDKKLTEVSNSQAVVSMILDTSGSMAYSLSGGNANSNNKSRISIMKDEATKLLNGFSEYPNIYVSLIPFNTTANGPTEMLNSKANKGNFLASINNLKANGGTNTGDGIRRGYYRIKEFNERQENINKTNKNFMIILVDGVTTLASATQHRLRNEEIFYNYHGPVYNYKGLEYRYYKHDYFFYYCRTDTSYFLGNSDVKTVNYELFYPDYRDKKYQDGRVIGNGVYLDAYGTEYVDKIGELVKTYKNGTNEAINVFVIGFSSDQSDYGSLEDIAKATRGDTVYYKADSQEALNQIFLSIQREISDALWHIGGPN
ncbi:VWA domain-containing protein [Soehngenia saccharolytica]|nr:VWA domain-containing protein [Soehngenia saccharolytica]